MEFDYKCIDCGKDKPKNAKRGMICLYCGGLLRGSSPAIQGTADCFGFKNQFKDEHSGKTITTRKDWKKAGYGDIDECVPDRSMRYDAKAKMRRCQKRGDRQFDNSILPGGGKK